MALTPMGTQNPLGDHRSPPQIKPCSDFFNLGEELLDRVLYPAMQGVGEKRADDYR